MRALLCHPRVIINIHGNSQIVHSYRLADEQMSTNFLSRATNHFIHLNLTVFTCRLFVDMWITGEFSDIINWSFSLNRNFYRCSQCCKTTEMEEVGLDFEFTCQRTTETNVQCYVLTNLWISCGCFDCLPVWPKNPRGISSFLTDRKAFLEGNCFVMPSCTLENLVLLLSELVDRENFFADVEI